MHLGAKPSLFMNADTLRRNLTEAEEILWNHLRNRQMEGVRFRRQHPMKNTEVNRPQAVGWSSLRQPIDTQNEYQIEF